MALELDLCTLSLVASGSGFLLKIQSIFLYLPKNKRKCAPPSSLTWQWNIPTIWRCITYWKNGSVGLKSQKMSFQFLSQPVSVQTKTCRWPESGAFPHLTSPGLHAWEPMLSFCLHCLHWPGEFFASGFAGKQGYNELAEVMNLHSSNMG